MTLDQHLTEELARLDALSLRRRPRAATAFTTRTITIDGRELLSFGSNDYLGLASSPELANRIAAAASYGVGAGASRLISGTRATHEHAQVRLAELVARPAALLFGSGYAANVGAISALVGSSDAIFSDRLNHASLIDGARLSKARVLVYEHADPSSLEALLRAHRGSARHALVTTESVFSMDGDLAPLRELAELARRYDAWLLVDEAHALGVIGEDGRGLSFEREVRPDVLVGTLGKALGLSGAFVAGSEALADYLYNRARSFVFSTALPPPYAAAVPDAVDLLLAMRDGRKRIARHRERLVHALSATGIEVAPTGSTIVPAIFGTPGEAQRVSQALLDRGIHATAIRPPTVPEGTSRIRIVPTAAHEDADIERLIDAIREVGPPITRARTSRSAPPRALRGWFVTGTGTGVGKTYVTTALTRAFAERGRVCALKPLETGCDREPLDGLALAAAARRPDLAHASGLYRARPPLAPWAASLEGEPIVSIDELAERVRELGARDLTLVEGAGGLLVPLTATETIADLATRLDLPLIAVARDELGVLSRVLETFEAAAHRSLRVAAVILNRGIGDTDPSRATNREILQARLPCPVVVLERGADALTFGRELRDLLSPEPSSLRARAP